MQRAERIVLVTGGTLIAAWYGDTEAVAPILGATLLICTLGSGATAVNRWIVAFRTLAAREVEPVVAVEVPPELPPLPPSRVSPSRQSAKVAITGA